MHPMNAIEGRNEKGTLTWARWGRTPGLPSWCGPRTCGPNLGAIRKAKHLHALAAAYTGGQEDSYGRRPSFIGRVLACSPQLNRATSFTSPGNATLRRAVAEPPPVSASSRLSLFSRGRDPLRGGVVYSIGRADASLFKSDCHSGSPSLVLLMYLLLTSYRVSQIRKNEGVHRVYREQLSM